MQMTLSSLQNPWKKAADLEGEYGEEGSESERREDQDHNLWYRTRPIAELRRVPMCHLLH